MQTHWCMAVIFMTEKRIQYYDSMSGSGTTCLNVLLRYLHDEMQHKKSATFDASDWELVTTDDDTPQQANGSDCGVFSCMFADYLSLNKVRRLCALAILMLIADHALLVLSCLAAHVLAERHGVPPESHGPAHRPGRTAPRRRRRLLSQLHPVRPPHPQITTCTTRNSARLAQYVSSHSQRCSTAPMRLVRVGVAVHLLICVHASHIHPLLLLLLSLWLDASGST